MRKTATYEGAPCRDCGSTTRYVSSRMCRGCNIAKATARRMMLPLEERRRRSRTGHLRQYNLTIEQFDAMFEAQGRACAICKTTDPTHKLKWNVDHNHETGAVRGILCAHCNTAIGFFRDSIPALAGAWMYLAQSESFDGFYPPSSEWLLHL